MGDLSGYFYNRLPDTTAIAATMLAMRNNGLDLLAALLEEAANLLSAYNDDPATTWGEFLHHVDPGNRLALISDRIRALNNYGLDSSSTL